MTTALDLQNFFSTTLTSDITAASTTIYLNAIPTAAEGYLVLEKSSQTKREIIYYTSKGANYVTCPSAAAGRGVGGTSAQAHTAGVVVDQTNNAEYWKALKDGTAIGAVILNANLATTAGEPGGAWKSWTPTFTNFTKGSATIVAQYTLIGKTVHFRLSVKLAADSSVGTNPTVSLPVTMATYGATSGEMQIGFGEYLDEGIQSYLGCLSPNSTTTVLFGRWVSGAGGINKSGLSATTPHTWGTGDELNFVGTYEAA